MPSGTQKMHSPTLADFESARKVIEQTVGKCKKTPLLRHWKDLESCAAVTEQCDLYLKMENTQVTGSYKVRGIINQLHQLEKEPDWNPEEKELVTLSGGNYGKTFAFLASRYKKRVVVMADSVPANRAQTIQSYGGVVDLVPFKELQDRVEYHVKTGKKFVSSLNGIDVIIGHGSLGLEILEDLPDPDIILVPCGGGCLLAGIAAAVHLSGNTSCRIYGVEPEQANTMWKSLEAGKPLAMVVKSIATGLTAPYVGEEAFELCQKYVEGILMVPESAIVQSFKDLYQQGLVVEPTAAVTYAALALGLVPNVTGRKIVAILTGRNVSPHEVCELFAVEQTTQVKSDREN